MSLNNSAGPLKYNRYDLSRIVIFCFLMLGALINLFPIFNLVLNSFRKNADIVAKPLGFEGLSFANYKLAHEFANLLMGMVNGVRISFFTIVLLIIAGTMSAYALTFIKTRANGVLAAIITLGYFIPPGSVLINAFLTLKSLNLTNSFVGIVIVYGFLFTPITMIILVGYMKTIPYAIIESATIDGANHFTTYWRIILPMVKSALVTLTILLFLWTYNDYMWPLILMARPAKRTIAVALTMFYDDRQQDFGLLAAAVIISLVPIMTTYIVLKDKIMAGMAAGSVKG